MSARAIREYDGKSLLGARLAALLHGSMGGVARVAQVHVQLTTPRLAPTAVATLSPSSPAAEGAIEPLALSAREIEQQLQKTFARVEQENVWLLSSRLVVKPDQLLKRRGKAGLILLNATWEEVKAWIGERAGSEVTIDGVSGLLKTFVVEPFVPHAPAEEYYVCIQSQAGGDELLFCPQGGVDVGNVDEKASRLAIPVDGGLSFEQVELFLRKSSTAGGSALALPTEKVAVVASFVASLYEVYADLHFTYLEINPLVVVGDKVYVLDMAAKIDQTAEYECSRKWAVPASTATYVALGEAAEAGGAIAPPGSLADGASSRMRMIDFPAPFGREMTPEEAYIAELDSKTGASLKLTILNKHGRIWTMVAGGGASVAYSDAIAATGMISELANYGEYSGAPSETQTYEYSKTILDLMTRGAVNAAGKVLFIGGGIANFTNVASTFKGIIRSLQEYRHRLVAHNVSIFVRRGGPNYQEGLTLMRELGDTLGVPIHVFGPETHITGIVPMALRPPQGGSGAPRSAGGDASSFEVISSVASLSGASSSRGRCEFNLIDQLVQPMSSLTSLSSASDAERSEGSGVPRVGGESLLSGGQSEEGGASLGASKASIFTKGTRSFVYGMQQRAVQGMLDYDYICKRSAPSVAALIYPFGGDHVMKFYWGTKEIMIPVYAKMTAACGAFPEVDVVVNFASYRSVPESCLDIIENCPQIRTIAIIAEGVPERHTKTINKRARDRGIVIIGPATVGGLRAGAFKIGNTGGMIDNIISSKLYRAGSVSYVSKSGGMSNELNNIIARTTNGVLEGIAIGGDRFPGSTFLDHILRFERDPLCKMIVLLGEVGGTEEYRICEARLGGLITKPVIAWCIGVCARMFTTEVQFGHAGGFANSDAETAIAKNAALRGAGVIVPESFEEMPAVIEATYKDLVGRGVIVPGVEPATPKVPIDYAWAQELGLIRKPAQFVSTICDDRGQELLYAGMPISSVFKEEIGIGGVLSLLWFRRRLPDYACKFIEMVLMLTADHGPAVSGAHNTIVAARAGKDLVSSLASGLLTIGDRFGGALDGAATQFTAAYDQGLSPADFVESMRKKHTLIMGIGHRIKSRTNPDLRVTILTEYAKRTFPTTPLLDYGLQVECLTTAKKDNLILNVDGATAILFVDLLRHSGAFTRAEADEYVRIGALNGPLCSAGRSALSDTTSTSAA